LEREAIIRPLAEQLRLSHAIIDDAAKQLHLSRVTLYRLLQRYRERPQTSSLLPWTRRRHCNSRFLSKDREALIATCIRGFYLVRERPSLAALFQEVRRCFAEHQLPTPNYRTVVKRVAAIYPRLAMTKREGAKAARDKFGPVGVSRLRPERLMEVSQIDHTPVDVIVVDQEQRRAIGWPWLTLAIDVTSRSIAGFSVSLENPRHFPSRWCSPMRFYPKRPGSPIASFTRSTGLWEDCQHRSMSIMPRSSTPKL
jgi:putative transposase